MTGADQDRRSHGLWAESAPAAPSTSPPPEGDVRADIVIVGAGYTGLSAALHLAEAGVRVLVLEGRCIGFGGSGRNVGLVNAGLWLPPDDVERVLGGDAGAALVHALGEGPALVYDLIARHGIACEAVRSGTLHCAVGNGGLNDLERRHDQWARRGAPVRLLDHAAATAAIGSHAYRGALLDERAGTIQPLAYARGLARAALAAGATIHEDSPVLACIADGQGVRVTTSSASVRAEQVIWAGNAYTAGPLPALRTELAHLPYFNLATAPLPEALLASILPGRQGAWDTRQILSSFRLDRAGRLIFGSVGALRGAARMAHLRWARRSLARIFPQLGDVGFESEWFGMIGMTTDAVPRLHRPAPEILSISGYNGRGIAPGTVFGRALARYLAHGEPVPMAQRPIERMPARRFREHLYEHGAGLAHVFGERISGRTQQ